MLGTYWEDIRQTRKLIHWLHVSMIIWVVLAEASVYSLLKQQHGFYSYSSPACTQVEKLCPFPLYSIVNVSW